MSKKTMVIAGVSIVVVLALGALFLVPRATFSPLLVVLGAGKQTTQSTSNGSTQGVGTATTQGQTAVGGSGAVTPNISKPYNPVKIPNVPAKAPTAPVSSNTALGPLTTAPAGTISGLKIGLIPGGTQYKIVMRPYGFGPTILLGSRVAVHVDSASPVGTVAVVKSIVNANVLALMDPAQAGAVTKGGTYTATMTFRSDGTKLLPVLSDVLASK